MYFFSLGTRLPTHFLTIFSVRVVFTPIFCAAGHSPRGFLGSGGCWPPSPPLGPELLRGNINHCLHPGRPSPAWCSWADRAGPALSPGMTKPHGSARLPPLALPRHRNRAAGPQVLPKTPSTQRSLTAPLSSERKKKKMATGTPRDCCENPHLCRNYKAF